MAPNTPCTSAPSGHLGCIALRSATVKNGHAWGFGFACGSGSGGTGAALGSGLGRLARRAEMLAPSGRGLGFGRGLFWRRLRGRLRGIAVLKDAVCRSLSLTGWVHTSKLVRVFLLAGGAKFEGLFCVPEPLHPAFHP